MSTLPFIAMTGGLVETPEMRFTPSGKAVINFRLATKKRVRDSNGQWVDGDPLYLTVSAWEKLAENAAETLTRAGQRVTVTGHLAQQWWEGKDGGKQSKFVIEADTISADLTFSQYTEKEGVKSEPRPASGGDDPWAAPTGTSTTAQPDSAPF